MTHVILSMNRCS